MLQHFRHIQETALHTCKGTFLSKTNTRLYEQQSTSGWGLDDRRKGNCMVQKDMISVACGVISETEHSAKDELRALHTFQGEGSPVVKQPARIEE